MSLARTAFDDEILGRFLSARPPLLLTGTAGLVGRLLHRSACASFRTFGALHHRSIGPLRRGDQRVPCDLERPGEGHRLVERCQPEVIVHAAALAALDACEAQPDRARRLNVEATRELAQAAAATGAYLVFLSTDQVFDGEGAPYREEHRAQPLQEYGRSKLEAEGLVQSICPDALVLRLSLVLGPAGAEGGGAVRMLRPGPTPRRVLLYQDEWRTPLAAPCLGRLMEGVLRLRPSGLLHAGGPDRVDRLELGRRILQAFGWSGVELVGGSRLSSAVPRPRDVSLDSTLLRERGLPAPLPLARALQELVDEGRGR